VSAGVRLTGVLIVAVPYEDRTLITRRFLCSRITRAARDERHHFSFRHEGIHSALEQAKGAAGEKDVRQEGGVSTIQQYLSVSLIDELHLAIVPVLLGSGEHLLRDLNLPTLG
jgi:dihydrofolate reductase